MTYTETGVAGVGNEGREFWLQYALRTLERVSVFAIHVQSHGIPTVAAEAWSSLAVDPQL